jgi:hypothetical protein
MKIWGTVRRPVTLGLRGEAVIEVARGLGDREAVVPASAAAVRVGQRVRPTAAPPAR